MNHDTDPTPPHGTPRPYLEEMADLMPHDPRTTAQLIDDLETRARAAWQWPATSILSHTWADVAALVARLDTEAIAAGHPGTYGKLHLRAPEQLGDTARIERIGSEHRIPGGATLGTDANTSHAILTARIDVYQDLADAHHDMARIHHLNRNNR